MISFRLLSAVMICFLTSSGLQAGIITFTFDGFDNGKKVISKTDSGVTLTLSNPVDGPFYADPDGIGLGLSNIILFDRDITNFDLEITGGVGRLIGYSVGYSFDAPLAYFSMSGGSGSSTNGLGSTGSLTANGDWRLAPGQIGTLSADNFYSGGFAQIKSLTFDVSPAVAAVPEPSTLGAIAAGLAAVVARRRRARAAQAEPVV
jgi:hypothetical protein